MDYEEEIKKIEAQGYRLQGSFINEHGERYLFFNHHMFDGFQIAGSETDWKVYELADNGEYAHSNFVSDIVERFEFSEYEKKEIKSMLQTLKHACI